MRSARGAAASRFHHRERLQFRCLELTEHHGMNAPMARPIRTLATATLTVVMTLGALAPAAADTYPRQPGIDVEEYVFRITLSDATDEIVGVSTAAIRLVENGVTNVMLDLIGRTGGRDTGMTVDSVRIAPGSAEAAAMSGSATGDDLGAPVRFAHTGDRLRITLPAAGVAGDRIFLSVAYHGAPATALIIGDNKYGDRTFFSDNWPSKARNWLPTIDHIGEKARMQMVVTAPNQYQVVSNGLLVEETDLGDGMRRTHWNQSVPIAPWLYMVGAARFAVDHLGTHRGVPVQTWVYAQDRDAGFYDFSYPTREVLDFYSEWVGPFAYEKLANIQSNSVRSGGMEAATAILYSADSVNGTRPERWRNVIIHEIAHQWFGNAVTEADWDDVWLSEGFATYFTALFIEHAYGRDEFVKTMTRARGSVMTFYETRPNYRIVHDNLADMGQVATGMQYAKGAWVLHMLRHRIGTETFWEGIRRYYARYYNGQATTTQFREVMEEVSGEDLELFFQQWLYQGSSGLALEGTWSYAANAAGGAVEVLLEQTQRGGTTFTMPVTLEFVAADGTTVRHTVEMSESNHAYSLAIDFEPVRVVVDPDTWLLMRADVTPR
jgi:aminopeptidase N